MRVSWHRHLRRPLESERCHLLMKVRALDVEQLGGAADVPVGALQDHLDVLLLALRLECVQRKYARTVRKTEKADLFTSLFVVRNDSRRQLFDGDRIGGEYRHLLGDVSELAYVAG